VPRQNSPARIEHKGAKCVIAFRHGMTRHGFQKNSEKFMSFFKTMKRVSFNIPIIPPGWLV
jgi:alanine racemase